MRDETFDYGLAPGESFEPVDETEDFDLSQPHIMTVLGPIDPDDLGVAVFLRSTPDGPAPWLRVPAQTVAALEDAFNAGLRAMVITDAIDNERDRSDLDWIAARSPVHILVFDERDAATIEPLSADIAGLISTTAATKLTASAADKLVLEIDTSPFGWAESLERAPISLMELGLSATSVRRILIDNPAKALTINA